MSKDNEFVVYKKWEHAYVSYCEPQILGAYSVDKDRQFQSNFSQLKYFTHKYPYGQEIRIDLESKYKDYVKRPKLEEKLNHLLEGITESEQILASLKSEKPDKWFEADFISYRGLLTKIMSTPYEQRNGWIICAMKFRGTIYLCGYQTEEEKRRNEQMSEREKRLCAYGYIFEHFLLSDDPAKSPSPDGPIYDAEEFNCVLQSKLGSHTICFGAEMDGIRSTVKIKENETLKSSCFVELKTTGIIKNTYQEKNFYKKILKWWCQSYLVGIRDITVGFRSDYGIIKQLINYETRELPEMVKQHSLWNSHVTLNFANEFLNFVKKTVTKNCDECVYKFTWEPNSNIFVNELSAKDELAFLPSWFLITGTVS